MPCMLLPCFEGPKEDWFCQLGHPRKIKNLLTYLLTYLTRLQRIMHSKVMADMRMSCMTVFVFHKRKSNPFSVLPVCMQ